VGPELGVFVLIVAVIGAFRWMPVARLVRAQFLSLREKELSRRRGRSVRPSAPVVRHILPNSLDRSSSPHDRRRGRDPLRIDPVISGPRFPPDIPTWGRIVFDAKDY